MFTLHHPIIRPTGNGLALGATRAGIVCVAPITTLMHLNLSTVVARTCTALSPRLSPTHTHTCRVYCVASGDGSGRAASVMRDACLHNAGLICMCEEVWANGADLLRCY